MPANVQKFKLSENFLDQYKNKKPNFGPLGEVTYLRTYSRFIPEENRNEGWYETVKRVVEGCFEAQKKHCSSLRLPWDNSKAQNSAKIMYDKIFNFKFLPAGRSLWAQGTQFVEERGSAALFNCSFATTEDIDTKGSFVFAWMMDALMCGIGGALDTKGAGKIKIKEPKKNDGLKFVIPDSREGWCESLSLLLDAYFYGRQMPTFDYSLIRPAGTPIKGFGGVASGHKALEELHKAVVHLLDKRIDDTITSTDIVDISNFIGRCVIAGNVRRSAILCLGDSADHDYVTMKDPKKHAKELMSHRWASNNSIIAEVGKTDYEKIASSIIANGEPGVIWLENMRRKGRNKDGINWADKNCMGVNACSEITLHSYELCNLVETFPSRHESYEEYKETLKYAYLYGKSMTLIPTHWPEVNAVIMKNRRIGISQSGIIDAFARHGRRKMLEWSDNGYKYLRELDEIYSDWLCIPRSIKITTVKPSGTTSLLPGVSPGIHYPHSEYYIRRIRIDAGSPMVEPLKKAGYEIENVKYGSDEVQKNTLVISFPVHEENYLKGKADASIWEQVKNVSDYQFYWSDNSVSVTVTFKEDEKKDISKILEAFEDELKTISFLPLENHGYEQAPYEEITKEKYKEMTKGISIPDFSGITTTPIGESFCNNDSGLCQITLPPLKNPA
jgi:ribonucleoside-triphosphate reductase (thioredoxin)